MNEQMMINPERTKNELLLSPQSVLQFFQFFILSIIELDWKTLSWGDDIFRFKILKDLFKRL